MKKCFLFAALGLSMMAQAVELDYYKTLVDEQAKATAGTTQLYNLEYAADGSLYLLSMYQTVSSAEVGLNFDGKTYQGATAAKWGSKAGEYKYTNMRNSFLAKLDAEGNLLWAKPDTTGDYDLAGTALMVTADGGVIYADKFRTRKGNYMSFINIYDKDGQLLGSNNMALTKDTLVINGKKVARNDAFAWAALAQDAEGYVYLAGYQADTLLPVWNDSIAPRKAWNYSGSKSDNCNTVILKYKPQPGQWPDLAYVGAVINSDELASDRPLGMHYENGKLYVAGAYKKDANESGIYAACYNTNLEREFIEYHPINATLQFQQTKFEDGKIFVCGGAAKGSVTVGEKTIATTGNFNHGLVYIINQADGKALDFDVHAAANSALNITVAAYPTKNGYVAYNHETLNGIQIAFTYDKDMNLVKADTIARGGGSSTINAVGRSVLRDHTLVGLRARTTGDYYLLDKDTLNFADKTNWYSLVAALNTESDKLPAKDTIQVDGLYYELNNIARTATLIRLNASSKYEIEDIVIPVYVSKEGRSYPVVALGQGAFRNTTAKSITFAEGSQVKELDMQAFQAAVNVEQIELPEGIKLIPMTCFNNANAANPTKTKKVVLPASIDSIARLSFSLPQLDTLEFKGALPPRINISTVAATGYVQNPWEVSKDHANNTRKAAIVVVPKGALEAYKNTAWIGDYFDTIVERKAPYLEATTIAEFNAAEDGELVKLTLTGAKVTAYADLQKVYYVEDATAATVISGAELTVGTALNGYITGTKSTNEVDYMNTPAVAVEPMMTVTKTDFTATQTTLTPTVMTIAEACTQENYAKLITIENVTISGSGKNKTLTDAEENTIKARDLFGVLSAEFVWPEEAASVTGICLHYMTGWFIIPTSEAGIVAKQTTGVENVQTDNVQCTKVLLNGQLYLMYKGRMYDVRGQVVK